MDDIAHAAMLAAHERAMANDHLTAHRLVGAEIGNLNVTGRIALGGLTTWET